MRETSQADAVVVSDRLHSAAIHLLRRVRQQDISAGVGPARLSALSVLVFGGPKTLGELAAAEQVKPPTMSRIVAALKQSHLVSVVDDPHDGRRMRIRATAPGTRLLQTARQLRVTALTDQVRRLRADEFHKLSEAVEILRKLLANWG